MLIRIILILLLAVSVSAQTPIGSNQWKTGTNSHMLVAGGPKSNYQSDGTWHEIDNAYISVGDSVIQCTTAIFQSRVRPNGESEVAILYGENKYTFTQRLVGFGWLNTDTQSRHVIDGVMNWSNVSFDSNVVAWRNVSPGINYEVIKKNTSVAHRITIKPGFLDSAVVLYDQLPDSANISFANLMKYTLSSNIDNYDSLYDGLSRRKLKQLGKIGFEIGSQTVGFQGSDTLPQLKVKQYYKLISDTLYMIEAIPMNRIKQIHGAFPNSSIWHNVEVRDSVGASSDDGHVTEWDSQIYLSENALYLGDSRNSFCRYSDVAVPGGATIDSAFWWGWPFNTYTGTGAIVDVQADDSDDPATFSTWADYDGRTWTTAAVVWQIDSLTWHDWDRGDAKSPDIKTVIQEIVDRGGWATGQAMVIHGETTSASSNRTFVSWDNSNDEAMKLLIYYTTGGGGETSTRRRLQIIRSD